MDYRSQGDTRVTINGSRHYKTPYGALPSVTTILSETQGNKAALERWAKKNPGGREAAAARGTKVHSLMEEYLLGIDRDPVIDDPEIAQFWDGLPNNLSKLESFSVKNTFDQTNFYLDIAGHIEDQAVQKALEELGFHTESLDILGVYEAAPFREKK